MLYHITVLSNLYVCVPAVRQSVGQTSATLCINPPEQYSSIVLFTSLNQLIALGDRATFWLREICLMKTCFNIFDYHFSFFLALE